MNDRPGASIRDEYASLGVENFYAQHAGDYRNPHEEAARLALSRAVEKWQCDLACVLDLACGSGEMTLQLRQLGATRVDGVDPYTADAYFARTGQMAKRATFEQIAAGALGTTRYSLIVCSYALHLVEPSRLPQLAFALGQNSPQLLVLSPHKRPQLRPEWGWRLVGEIYPQRVRTRLYEWGWAT